MYKLPYLHAAMLIRSSGESFEYTKQPPGSAPARKLPRALSAGFRAACERKKNRSNISSRSATALYTVDHGQVRRAYIHHMPSKLQDAEAEIDVNTKALASGIEQPDTKPLLHFSRNIDVLAWWPEKV